MPLRFLASYILGLLFAYGTCYFINNFLMSDSHEIGYTQSVDCFDNKEHFELNNWTFLRMYIRPGLYELYNTNQEKIGIFREISLDEWELVNTAGITCHHFEIVDEESKKNIFQKLSTIQYDWVDISISCQNLTQDDLSFLEKCRFNAITLWSVEDIPEAFWRLDGVSCAEYISLNDMSVTSDMMREFSKYQNLKTFECNYCVFSFNIEKKESND